MQYEGFRRRFQKQKNNSVGYSSKGDFFGGGVILKLTLGKKVSFRADYQVIMRSGAKKSAAL
jgi:hypothetical protein